LWGPLCGRTGRTCLNPPLFLVLFDISRPITYKQAAIAAAYNGNRNNMHVYMFP